MLVQFGNSWIKKLLCMSYYIYKYWAIVKKQMQTNEPCLIKIWLTSSNISQPSAICLSMDRFLRMFSVSLTSSCITCRQQQKSGWDKADCTYIKASFMPHLVPLHSQFLGKRQNKSLAEKSVALCLPLKSIPKQSHVWVKNKLHAHAQCSCSGR